MNQIVLRLELVKLTYTHGRLATEAVERAKELEKYVSEETPQSGQQVDRDREIVAKQFVRRKP